MARILTFSAINKDVENESNKNNNSLSRISLKYTNKYYEKN